MPNLRTAEVYTTEGTENPARAGTRASQAGGGTLPRGRVAAFVVLRVLPFLLKERRHALRHGPVKVVDSCFREAVRFEQPRLPRRSGLVGDVLPGLP